jgi:hypothetical protein
MMPDSASRAVRDDRPRHTRIEAFNRLKAGAADDDKLCQVLLGHTDLSLRRVELMTF